MKTKKNPTMNCPQQSSRTKAELINLKFAAARIYEYSCDIKGEPIGDISTDSISFSILFPTRTTVKKVNAYTKQIVKAVNILSVIEKSLQSTDGRDDLTKLVCQQLLKQAEQKINNH